MTRSNAIPFCYGAGSWLVLAGAVEAFAALLEEDLSAEALFMGLVALPMLVCFFTDFFTAVAYMIGSSLIAPIICGADSFIFYIFGAAIFLQIGIFSTNIIYYSGLKYPSEILDLFEEYERLK